MDTIMKRIEDAMEFQVKGDPLSFGNLIHDDDEDFNDSRHNGHEGFGDLIQIDYRSPVPLSTFRKYRNAYEHLNYYRQIDYESRVPPSKSDVPKNDTSSP
ncbi:hypothetical protein L2E82_35700 [Cichorium intybus]|uniref:Uncharacterized protein n=1 Tax=Cichorium intybus TaxID=13427 RepID=A0ACB9BPT3_CICIN|nr:hypothetical protein L2E82_35700 [Cichorium intybus]